MTYLVRRTCTEIVTENAQVGIERPSRRLEDFRGEAAYVLLGAPGAGKTGAFRLEARECPDGHCVTARDFDTFDDRPEWHGATLFIDGFDERRAGSTEGSTPLDRIRNKLDSLGRPRFRLSCRHADWFGANDRTHLEKVSGDGSITVLELDPLSENDIREILPRNHEVEDADAFIATARERGIDTLLHNPENLKMLAEAVAGGEWPETRTRTFELACRKLALEPNCGHRLASPDRPDIARLLDAAGRLCVVQLLSGRAGYALAGDASDDPDYPGLAHISGETRSVLRHALRSRLFVEPPGSLSSEGRRIPAHRQTAEFLAARYLAGLIENGLPLGRILALMTGYDGIVVSELRGLCAWLATHSKPARAELIAPDPLGTILYGDVQEFSIAEKRILIDGIKREAKSNPWLFSVEHSNLGGLSTPDMDEVFRQILADPARDDAHQSLIVILLKALIPGDVLPDLAPLVTEIVRDDTWEHGVRSGALKVLIAQHPDGTKTTDDLGILLEDIRSGAISDPDDDLLGALLIELYSGGLSTSDILQHMRSPRNPSHFGTYWLFWFKEVPEKSTNTQRAELLDMLVETSSRLNSTFHTSSKEMNYMRRIPSRLLTQLLQHAQEPISAHRFFAWLGLAFDPKLRISAKDREYIRSWLDGHDDELKRLIEFGLSRCVSSPDFSRCMRDVERLFNTLLTPKLGPWFLEKSISTTNPDIAEYAICRVADSIGFQAYEHHPSRQDVVQRLAEHEELLRSFNQRLELLKQNDEQQSRIRERDDEDKRRRQQEWRNHVRVHEAALRENRCQPAVLNQFALAYFDQYIDVDGNSPRERIADLIGNDENATRVVLSGLEGTIARHDLPEGNEVLNLYSRGERHYMALPYMAGLEETVGRLSDGKISLDERQMRLGLTIYYAFCTPRSPTWLPQLLESNPELVADVLASSLRSGLRSGADQSAVLSELAHSEAYDSVARFAAQPLLEAFPVRCSKQQLRGLGHLLRIALTHCDATRLLELVERKLAHSSMNIGQRISWLVAGLVATSDAYSARLETYVVGNERRARCLAQALAGYERTPHLVQRLDLPALGLLIRLLGASFRPWSPGDRRGKVHVPSPAMEASDLVRFLIDRVSSNPSRTATEALESLAGDSSLHPWRFLITNAIRRQNIRRRESGFEHCDTGTVLEVLDNRTPANVADLFALTADYLREIAETIRNGSTCDWRQYWNVDSYNRPQSQKPEDACRDALLSALQQRVERLGIDAAREGQYADDKRSDIRVFCGGFNVPVEIKKSNHRDLWSAIRNQLMAKYTRDPGAAGYGIYLVFWFGETDCQPPESGRRPKSAVELEGRLWDTLSMDEANRISVCVVDVVKPPT